jgi:hypothetical protein
MFAAVDTDDGRGVVGTGGNATVNGVIGGFGVEARGGTSINSTGGHGLVATGGTSTSGTGGSGVRGQGASGAVAGVGVFGLGGGTGGAQAHGVLGTTNSSFNSGVHGANAGSGPGVSGQATSTTNAGVQGVNTSTGPGVRGAASQGVGVYGVSDSQAGVFGLSVASPGVHGESTNSLGIRGISNNFVGIVGISNNNHGLYGSTAALGAAGIVAENTSGGLGLVVTGNAQVFGSLQVFGAKNAVIKMPDGSNASVYCQESPEPYFEDFGRGQLLGGVASIQLEREYASLVAGGDYMVFLTPQGDTRGLFVTRQGPGGFEVRECQGGTSSIPFTYRVVTRRKDIEGRRFARVSDEVRQNIAAARAVIDKTPRGNVQPLGPSDTQLPGPAVGPLLGPATPGAGVTAGGPIAPEPPGAGGPLRDGAGR